MSDTASNRFLSWARRGAAAQIDTEDPSPTAAARVQVPISVRFNGNGPSDPLAEVSLELLGPGDVVALDRRAIVRAWPPAETRDAEPNYFPLVELDQADLPWRYTPRKANATGQLRPWLCLIVIEEGQGTFEAQGGGRPDKVRLNDDTPMPLVDQSWAWAHVQISGDVGTAAEAIKTRPEHVVARLLCPRRLEANKTYWAMLVPTFAAGVRAGLGIPEALNVTEDLAPAWEGTTVNGELVLPVYYRWRFGTGQGGDFETLVSALRPQPLASTVGVRSLDVSRVGTLPPAATAAVPIGGALRAPLAQPWAWPTDQGERAIFIQILAALLDFPDVVRALGGTPVVAPPLYGAWHARSWRLQSGAPPTWFRDLNEDPRKRIAAALGTEVVQVLQEDLMASAWEQVAGIREANDQLRKAQLARAIAQRLHRRFIEPRNADSLLTFAAQALGHVRPATKTLRALVQNSPVRLALVGGAFRRVARRFGPLGRRQQRASLENAQVLSRVNDGTYDSVLAAVPPMSVALPTWSWAVANIDGWPAGLDHPPTAAEVQAQPPQTKAVVWDPQYGGNPPTQDPGSGGDTPSMTRFRSAAIAFAGRNVAPVAGEKPRRLDMAAVRAAAVAALDPAVTIPAALRDRMVGRPGFTWNPPDPIEPVMAHPEFPQPMYKPLAARSPDWILPGLADVAANSVALAVTNPAFIEAYMVGLNHEMSRELLWREYPTDQRGSYFRQFWDPAGLPPPPVPEAGEDIHPLNLWDLDSQLGEHSPRPVPPPPNNTHLVLLVRGEVLRRYPGTLVYAQRAQGPEGNRTLAVEQRRPLFGGRLDPDVAFFGFNLTVTEARGGAADPGWFFVFEEQPSEPRFGLDAAADPLPEPPPPRATSWDQLAWHHVAATPYIDLSDPLLPDTGGIIDPEGAGWHLSSGIIARGADHALITFQRPVRVAMHGSVLLPP